MAPAAAVDELQSEGWFVDSLKAENFFEADYCTMKASTLRDLLLDADIKDVSLTVLADTLDKKKGELKGPLVLQLSGWRNISYPKIPDHTENDGICKIMLTDGFTSVPCLQIDTSLSINGNTSYGTKVQLNGNITYECGHLILNPKNCKVLGGNVEKLVEKWKIGKMGSAKDVEKGPNYVKFIPYSEKKNSALDVKMKNLGLNANSNGDQKKARNEKPKERKSTERQSGKTQHVSASTNPLAQPFDPSSNRSKNKSANSNKNVQGDRWNDIEEKQRQPSNSSDTPRQRFDPPVPREVRQPPGNNANLREMQPQRSKPKQFPSNLRRPHPQSIEFQASNPTSQSNTSSRFPSSAPPPGFQNDADRMQFQPPIASEFEPSSNCFSHGTHQFQQFPNNQYHPPNNLHFQSSGHRHDFHPDHQRFPNHHNSIAESYPYNNFGNPLQQEGYRRDFSFNNNRNTCPPQQFFEEQHYDGSVQIRGNDGSGGGNNQNRQQYSRGGGPLNRRGGGGQQRRFVNANYRRNPMGQ